MQGRGDEPPPEGFESFDLEHDYVGGKWIDGEFFYEEERKRGKRKMTKQDHIYGVFYEGEDGDEEDDFKRGKKRGER